jgi:hypothetical protein
MSLITFAPTSLITFFLVLQATQVLIRVVPAVASFLRVVNAAYTWFTNPFGMWSSTSDIPAGFFSGGSDPGPSTNPEPAYQWKYTEGTSEEPSRWTPYTGEPVDLKGQGMFIILIIYSVLLLYLLLQ